MRKKNSKKNIMRILKNHPEGLTIQQLSKLAKTSRITATKYIHELLGEGKLFERNIGIYRIFFWKEKFFETLREWEIIEKIKKRIR